VLFTLEEEAFLVDLIEEKNEELFGQPFSI
jgi:hypothetical protein